ncbi:MAG: TRC40/GET3/ArsA family transport-energizing ATPase [Actinomycetota bacterium]|nr:TRC40/GET3/ArsA family transport-energizing ATPase [Actinomycetota bacterium]
MSNQVRLVLFSGKGGVGKSTLAAATAVQLADAGRRVRLVSTDPAHSCGDVLALPMSPGAANVVNKKLSVTILDAHTQRIASWRALQAIAVELLTESGVDPIHAAELTILPGIDELLSLLAVTDLLADPEIDVVVVDGGPTAETARLLALPEALEQLLAVILTPGFAVARAARGPVAAKATVLTAVQELAADLGRVKNALSGVGSVVRLVTTPEKVVLAETRRHLATLTLLGHHVDAVFVNRYPISSDNWPRKWAQKQRKRVRALRADLVNTPIITVPFKAAEPIGKSGLRKLPVSVRRQPADCAFTKRVPSGVLPTVSGYEWRIPLADPADQVIKVGRLGDNAIIVVGATRRVLALPPVLCRCVMKGAVVRAQQVVIAFEPDESIWRQA